MKRFSSIAIGLVGLSLMVAGCSPNGGPWPDRPGGSAGITTPPEAAKPAVASDASSATSVPDPLSIARRVQAGVVETTAPSVIDAREAITAASLRWTDSDMSTATIVVRKVFYSRDTIRGRLAWLVGVTPAPIAVHGVDPFSPVPAQTLFVIDADTGNVIDTWSGPLGDDP